MVVCIAEDRSTHEPAVQVIIASLLAYHAAIKVAFFCPSPSPELIAWIATYPSVSIRPKPSEADGWNIKPHALLTLLDEGHDRVVWLDSDMVLSRSLGILDQPPADDVVTVAEEALWGTERADTNALRARLWGFQVGRILPHVLNTCVLGVTQKHRGLLEEWRDLLGRPDYMAAQTLSFSQRPIHFGSDQDVFTSLLSTERFKNIPLQIVVRGRDIVQYFGPYGFTVLERVRAFWGRGPSIYHSQGSKPWLLESKTATRGRLSNELLGLYADASPYIIAARRLGISYIGGNSWLRPRRSLGAAARTVGFGSPALTGLPIAAGFDLVRGFKTLRSAFKTKNA